MWRETSWQKVVCLLCVCVCMYICTYVFMYVCTYACIYVLMYEYMYECTCVCKYVCMHVCIYVCMHICMYAYMHVCIYACMYVCMHVCMYACMYIYACMYVCMQYVYMYVCTICFTEWASWQSDGRPLGHGKNEDNWHAVKKYRCQKLMDFRKGLLPAIKKSRFYCHSMQHERCTCLVSFWCARFQASTAI